MQVGGAGIPTRRSDAHWAQHRSHSAATAATSAMPIWTYRELPWRGNPPTTPPKGLPQSVIQRKIQLTVSSLQAARHLPQLKYDCSR